MKIIKKGENWCTPTFTEVMVECDNCESKLEIEAEDVMESIGVLFFECPVCFKRNILKSDIKERYLNWIEYRDKKSRIKEEIQAQSMPIQESKENLDMIMREIGYWAKQCE